MQQHGAAKQRPACASCTKAKFCKGPMNQFRRSVELRSQPIQLTFDDVNDARFVVLSLAFAANAKRSDRSSLRALPAISIMLWPDPESIIK
jgi:hypothetical protein